MKKETYVKLMWGSAIAIVILGFLAVIYFGNEDNIWNPTPTPEEPVFEPITSLEASSLFVEQTLGIPCEGYWQRPPGQEIPVDEHGLYGHRFDISGNIGGYIQLEACANNVTHETFFGIVYDPNNGHVYEQCCFLAGCGIDNFNKFTEPWLNPSYEFYQGLSGGTISEELVIAQVVC